MLFSFIDCLFVLNLALISVKQKCLSVIQSGLYAGFLFGGAENGKDLVIGAGHRPSGWVQGGGYSSLLRSRALGFSDRFRVF